jgi:hypothetical protein
MENLTPYVMQAERLNGAVVITFDDGKCAVYSAALLYAMFPQADRVDESYLDEQD